MMYGTQNLSKSKGRFTHFLDVGVNIWTTLILQKLMDLGLDLLRLPMFKSNSPSGGPNVHLYFIELFIRSYIFFPKKVGFSRKIKIEHLKYTNK